MEIIKECDLKNVPDFLKLAEMFDNKDAKDEGKKDDLKGDKKKNKDKDSDDDDKKDKKRKKKKNGDD